MQMYWAGVFVYVMCDNAQFLKGQETSFAWKDLLLQGITRTRSKYCHVVQKKSMVRLLWYNLKLASHYIPTYNLGNRKKYYDYTD